MSPGVTSVTFGAARSDISYVWCAWSDIGYVWCARSDISYVWCSQE